MRRYLAYTASIATIDAGGKPLTITWQGRSVQSWLPARLTEREFRPAPSTALATGRAAVEAVRASTQIPAGFESIARLLLRQEGVASSFIEGLETPLPDIMMAELGRQDNLAAAWIADNLTAMAAALHDTAGPISKGVLDSWHAKLMSYHSGAASTHIGHYRQVQSWVGGSSPLDAAFVPPPPQLVLELMEDLLGYVNRDDLDPIAQAAIAHVQFETIHPYPDGNGRIGRILFGWVVAHRLGLRVAPPISVFIARDPGGYQASLYLFRRGDTNAVVEWLAQVTERASLASSRLAAAAQALEVDWLGRASGLRHNSAGRRLIPLLLEHPVTGSDTVAASLKVSIRSAQVALSQLAELKIVRPYLTVPSKVGRPRQWWVAQELVEVIRSWPALGAGSSTRRRAANLRRSGPA